MKHVGYALLFPVLGLLLTPVFAQNPQAKDAFEKAKQAATAKDFKTAVEQLRAARTADPQLWAWADSSLADQILGGLKEQVKAKQDDVTMAKYLGWIYAERGLYKEGLAEYKRIQGQAGTDAEVKEQIRVLEAYVQQPTGSSGSSGSGSSGSSGGDSSGGSGGSSGSGGGNDNAAGGGGGGGGGDSAALQEQLKKKDEEIASFQKEKEDFQRKITDLEAEIKSLQIYKTKINMQGGLR